LKERSPKEWMEEVRAGLEYRWEFGKEQWWDRLDSCYFNEPDSEGSIGENLIFEQGDALQAGVAVGNPELIIDPEDLPSAQNLQAVEQLSNFLLYKLMVKDTVEECTLNAYICGPLIAKVGYDSEFGYAPEYDMGQLIGREMGTTSTMFNKKGSRIEFGDVTPGMPWACSVDPRDFVVPVGCKSIETAEWCAHRIVRNINDVKADPKYKNTKDLQPNVSFDALQSGKSSTDPKVRRQRVTERNYISDVKVQNVELWEIHDRRTKKIYAICQDYDKYLRNGNDVLQIGNRLPFIVKYFVRNPRFFWTTPLAFYVYQHQLEMKDVAVQGSKQRRLNNVRFLVLDGSLSKTEEERALNDPRAVFVHVNQASGDVNKAFGKFPTVTNYDLVMEGNNVRSNARSAIGFSRNQLGEFDDSSRRTAREVSTVDTGARKRENRRFSAVSGMYEDIVERAVNFAATFWRMERTIKGQDGKWEQVSGSQLNGKYRYTAHLTEKAVMNRYQRRMAALQLFANLLQIPGANPQALWNYVIQQSDDPEFASFFQAPQTMTGGGTDLGGAQMLMSGGGQ
jgi:hypothetical protein